LPVARWLAFCARNDSEFDPRVGVREFNRYGKSVGDKSNWSGSVSVFFGCAPKKGKPLSTHNKRIPLAVARYDWNGSPCTITRVGSGSVLDENG
jgi:hypothetical protein